MSRMNFDYCVFTNRAPNLASAVDAATSLRIAHVIWMLSLRKMGLLFCGTVHEKQYPPALLLPLLADRYYASEWTLRMMSDAWNLMTAYGLEYI